MTPAQKTRRKQRAAELATERIAVGQCRTCTAPRGDNGASTQCRGCAADGNVRRSALKIKARARLHEGWVY